MNHFNRKSLLFYGAILTFVVTLFNLTTSYGEANLQAPAKISGRYRWNAKNLPGCFKAETLILTVEQSGIYLNGSLLSEQDETQAVTAAKKKPLLTGLFQQQLELSGQPSLEACQAEATEQPIRIQAMVNQSTLKGTLYLMAGSFDFTAQRDNEQDNESQSPVQH